MIKYKIMPDLASPQVPSFILHLSFQPTLPSTTLGCAESSSLWTFVQVAGFPLPCHLVHCHTSQLTVLSSVVSSLALAT